MIELDVLGIRLVAPDDDPVLLLEERGGTRVLPIWISAVDAAAIALALDDEAPTPRPLTQDLVAELISMLGEDLSTGRIRITHVDDGIFFAEMVVGNVVLDVRPSDGVGVGLRLGWPIWCESLVMDQVGVEIEDVNVDEVEAFREFLDTVSPDDFETKTDDD